MVDKIELLIELEKAMVAACRVDAAPDAEATYQVVLSESLLDLNKNIIGRVRRKGWMPTDEASALIESRKKYPDI